jgi:hypothetical protein
VVVVVGGGGGGSSRGGGGWDGARITGAWACWSIGYVESSGWAIATPAIAKNVGIDSPVIYKERISNSYDRCAIRFIRTVNYIVGSIMSAAGILACVPYQKFSPKEWCLRVWFIGIGTYSTVEFVPIVQMLSDIFLIRPTFQVLSIYLRIHFWCCGCSL